MRLAAAGRETGFPSRACRGASPSWRNASRYACCTARHASWCSRRSANASAALPQPALEAEMAEQVIAELSVERVAGCAFPHRWPWPEQPGRPVAAARTTPAGPAGNPPDQPPGRPAQRRGGRGTARARTRRRGPCAGLPAPGSGDHADPRRPVADRRASPGTSGRPRRPPFLGAIHNDRKVHATLIGPDGSRYQLEREPRLGVDDFVLRKKAAVAGLGVTLLPEGYCDRERPMAACASCRSGPCRKAPCRPPTCRAAARFRRSVL